MRAHPWLVWLACVLAASVAVIAVARGHEAPSGWTYPMECCSNQDCREMTDQETPRPNANGDWVLITGEIVPKDKVKFSPDGRFHICRWSSNGAIICFFTPPQGS